MEQYTVVLRSPDYLGFETVVNYVADDRHSSPETIARYSRELAADKYQIEDPDDFLVVFMCKGYNRNLI